MDASTDEVRLTLRVPSDLHGRLSAWAAREERSINQQIVYLLSTARPDAIKGRPSGWGRDSLSEFAERHLVNTFGFFSLMPDWIHRLANINDVFRTVGHNLTDPEDVWSAFFLARCQSAFLAASLHAIAGQVGDTAPLTRSCIEWAIYAVHFQKHPDQLEVWLERGDGAEARRKAAAAARPSKMLEDVDALDPLLGKALREIYETSIEFGAHPNIQALFGNMHREERNGDQVFTNKMLTADEFDVRVAIKQVARAGLAALLAFEHLLPARFRDLGAGPRIRELTTGL